MCAFACHLNKRLRQYTSFNHPCLNFVIRYPEYDIIKLTTGRACANLGRRATHKLGIRIGIIYFINIAGWYGRPRISVNA